jgi:hypothetical protein
MPRVLCVGTICFQINYFGILLPLTAITTFLLVTITAIAVPIRLSREIFSSTFPESTAGRQRLSFDYLSGAPTCCEFGSGYIYHTFEPGVTRIQSAANNEPDGDFNLELGNDPIYAHEAYLFAEDNFDITPRLKANIGLHLLGFSVQDVFYPSLEPRASLRFLVNEQFSLKASYSKMSKIFICLAVLQ